MGDKTINEYANSMFRFEGLNEAWLNSCADYLKLLFGDYFVGKTVIDYAFGRGNWSIAFQKAGAKEVISVDASYDNVRKFESFCKQNNITNISVIHGNILEQEMSLKADFVWLYGILPCIIPKDIDIFLSATKQLLRDQQSQLYIYSYNRNSLRNLTVDLCRDLFTYKNEEEFINDNYLFLRSAKNRASDDLVAPCVNWFTEQELQNILKKNGLFVYRQDIDYFEFINNVVNEEFYPIQFLCGLRSSGEITVKQRVQGFEKEMKFLLLLARDIFPAFDDDDEYRKISIGLFNTHFASLKNGYKIREALIEIFLFLMRLLVQAKEFKKSKFSDITEKYCSLITKSMIDADRTKETEILEENIFTQFLSKNRVRL